ncbi:GNAT family N-acetyltransferase [Undibacterium flavidum]|uniref:GNAT family N-acetyltransferase n=1 Tax=Undibacterium flavidum TaxID=2762297 RepID=A0ABR6YHK1_9BURK|nr:GNAT family N-acetyltransferase [Undibacterium flavidum]MBC3876059.1 GNAT family N-acetyltransferase [Undibacterium flavidum]
MSSVLIREIRETDNAAVAALIRAVLTEMEVPKVGSAFADPSLDYMYQHYQQDKGAYYVVEVDGVVLAGGGFGRLPGAPAEVCELQKMYMLPQARGLGLGQQLIERCVEDAKELNYTQCYLETLPNMLAAQKLYQKMGFQYIQTPMGNTGHNACPVWMLLKF